MPVVAMPDGSQVEMPDKIDPATQARLGAVLAKQKTQPASKLHPANLDMNAPFMGMFDKNPKDVDYRSGLTIADRTALDEADNTKEKLKYLRGAYGAGNVEQLKDGTLVVKKDEKRIAAEGGSAGGGLVATSAAAAPEVAGMAAGAARGASLGRPLGIWGMALGGVGGAILGAVTGKSIDEAKKALQGRTDKTGAETVDAYKQSAIGGAEGEVGGAIVGKIASRLSRGPLPKMVTQVTPEVAAMNERVLAGGARPPAQSALPGLKHIQWMETFAEKINAPNVSANKANAAYIEKRMGAILSDAKLPEKEISPTIRELARGDTKIPTEQVGTYVKDAARAHKEMIQGQVDKRLADVNKLLDDQTKRLATLTRADKSSGLGEAAATGIRESRRDFGTAMSKGYQKVDSLVGNEPLIPTMIINKEARNIVRKAPQSVQAALTKELADVGIELNDDPTKSVKKISFGDAQRIRTILREKSDESALTRGATQGEFAHLASMVDHSIQIAARDPVAKPAVKLLNKLDEVYAKGIRKFDDATVKTLVSNMRAGIMPDPETVAHQIIKPGNIERVKEVRRMVGPDAWKKVVGADYTNIIHSATDDIGAVDGMKLLHQVTLRGPLMDEVYGKTVSKDITQLARSMAVRDSGLPITALNPGLLKSTVTQLKAEETQLNDFMKKNALSTLLNPKQSPERAYAWLVKPENGSSLRQAIKLMGEDSPKTAQLRQVALKQLLSEAKMSCASGKAPDALLGALAKYTPEQQKLLFPHGQADDLNLLGKEIKFVMSSLKDESMAGFGAGAVLSPATPFFVRIPLQVTMGVYQAIISQPGVIRYLALGLRGDSRKRIATRELIKNLVRTGGIEANQGAQNEPAN